MNPTQTNRIERIEDELISPEEEEAVTRSKAWFFSNDGMSWEQLVNDLGFSVDEITNASHMPMENEHSEP